MQHLNPGRTSKLNCYIVKDYFAKLRDVMLEWDVADKSNLIYNVGEKGCKLTLHRQQQVFARKGVKRPRSMQVIVLTCGNVMGQFVSPVILFTGKLLKPEWEEKLPPGSNVVMTPKGSMTCETFSQWIDHFAKYKASGDRTLLIFDGASSHLDANIVSAADRHNLTLFCLHSNTTHELQPLDKSMFKFFE
ncbi:hypothetical protein PR048_001649 [Dryococelus australis]|uniref:DDE-1 domain-containing protein n=1 Tax=Dryococelus australis TaxID=614101 RepID=A0ABQ9IJD8_9NEOP|nr:hypothetical protein PR048_001649 [Dryococelus australis]